MKRFLGILLTMALLVTMLSGMLVPVTAASVNGYDVLAAEYSMNIPGKEDPATSTITKNDDGSITINFPNNDGSEVVFDLNGLVEGGASIKDFPFMTLVATSDMAFDLCLYDPVYSHWISAWGNWCGDIKEGSKPSENNGKIPAGSYDATFKVAGCYEYNWPDQLDTAKLLTVAIVPGGTGSVTLKTLTLSDGMTDIDLNTRGDVSGYEWDAPVNMIAGEATNFSQELADGTVSNIKVTKNDDGSVSYGNTAGSYPFAGYTYATPYVVDENAAIDFDFTIKSGYISTIYVFMGDAVNGKGSTPDQFGYGTYVHIPFLDGDSTNAELTQGNYKGTLFLKDILNACVGNLDNKDEVFDANGNFIINGIKICVNGPATDEGVVVRKMDLLTLKKDAPIPSTTKKEDRTTTTRGQETQGANGNTTTVNNGGAAGGNSASTGDVSEAALFIVVAAAAAAVVTLSVVSKKAKSR